MDWEEVPLPGLEGEVTPLPRGWRRSKGSEAWAERVRTAIAVIDRVHAAQKGATVIVVPVDALITVQVAAATAADAAAMPTD